MNRTDRLSRLAAVALGLLLAVTSCAPLGRLFAEKPPPRFEEGTESEVASSSAVSEAPEELPPVSADLSLDPYAYYPTGAPVGAWARYRRNGVEESWAVVGEQTFEGARLLWVEHRLVPGGTEKEVVRWLLVSPPAEDAEPACKGEVLLALQGFPGQAPSRASFRAADDVWTRWDLLDGAEAAGEEAVEVPAGRFACRKLALTEGGHAWMADEVAFGGMVRLLIDDPEAPERIELLAHGRDRKPDALRSRLPRWTKQMSTDRKRESR